MIISKLTHLNDILTNYPDILKYYLVKENEFDVLRNQVEIIDFMEKEGNRDIKFVSIDNNFEGLILDIELY